MQKMALHRCGCGYETPYIEKMPYYDGFYRVVCPKCYNGKDSYFSNSMDECAEVWNAYIWKRGRAI